MTSILVVDDSSSMRDLVQLALIDAGYEVAQAADGVEALEKARKNQFDLVVADVNMPKMDGIELIRELRADRQYRFTPILMLTTVSDPEKRREGKAAGATGWIVKPFDPVRLLDSMRRALQ